MKYTAPLLYCAFYLCKFSWNICKSDHQERCRCSWIYTYAWRTSMEMRCWSRSRYTPVLREAEADRSYTPNLGEPAWKLREAEPEAEARGYTPIVREPAWKNDYEKSDHVNECILSVKFDCGLEDFCFGKFFLNYANSLCRYWLSIFLFIYSFCVVLFSFVHQETFIKKNKKNLKICHLIFTRKCLKLLITFRSSQLRTVPKSYFSLHFVEINTK